MFGYRNKKLVARCQPKVSLRSILCSLLSSAVLLASLTIISSAWAADSRWQNNNSKDKKALIEQRRKEFESLSPAERKKIKNRYEWYKDLPADKQKELRERWKKSDK